MTVKALKKGYHVSSPTADVTTPEGTDSGGIYVENGFSSVWLHYTGDDAVAEGHPGMKLPMDHTLLKDLAKALNKIVKDDQARRTGR